MGKDEMVILTQTRDLLMWLLPCCDKFPRGQRFVVTKRLQDAALDFQESLFDANARSGNARLQHLQAADAHLNKLRLYLRFTYEWRWLTGGQYQHASRMVNDIGKLLGGWIRQTRTSISRKAE
jgi:hypothetical protein